MNCPYLKEEDVSCLAEMPLKERRHVLTRLELSEFCRNDRHVLCYFFFAKKDATDARA